mgnify:CR=1 FL=1
MGTYAVYLTDRSYIEAVVSDIARVGGRVITISPVFGVVVAEIPDTAVNVIMSKPYVRMVEKTYPFRHM